MPKASSQMGHFAWGALQRADKSSLLTNDQFRGSSRCSFFSIFSCRIKTGDQPQEDLVRSGYKTNKEVKIMAILLHVGEPIEPINMGISKEES